MEIDYTDNVDKILAALDDAVAVALEKCGLLAEGYAKKLGSVDTGNLRNSITHSVDADGRCAYVGTNVEYAPYVEYGTYKM